jgi:hypothetical protein
MLVVKECDIYGEVKTEYFFRTKEKAKEKVKEILKADQKRNPDCYEELLEWEEFNNDFEALVEWFWEDGGMDETFSIWEFEFEEDKE